MTDSRVYVGTYAKYNDGSIFGEWLDLSDYSDKNDFLEACMKLHEDEEDPELMFQDWENIPDKFISECSIDDEYWEYMEVTKDWDETRTMAFEMWMSHYGGNDITTEVEHFEDNYMGTWRSERDFSENLADELGYYDTMRKAGISAHYFDDEAFSRDLFMSDYWSETDGNHKLHVFRNY